VDVGGQSAPASDLEAALGIDLSGPSGQPENTLADDGWDGADIPVAPPAPGQPATPGAARPADPSAKSGKEDWSHLDPLSTSDISMIGTYSEVGGKGRTIKDHVWEEQQALAGEKTPVGHKVPDPIPAGAPRKPRPAAKAPVAQPPPPIHDELTSPEREADDQPAGGPVTRGLEEGFVFEGTLGDAAPRGEDVFPQGAGSGGLDDFGLGGASGPISFEQERPAAGAAGETAGYSEGGELDFGDGPAGQSAQPSGGPVRSEEAPDSIFAIEEQSGLFTARDKSVSREPAESMAESKLGGGRRGPSGLGDFGRQTVSRAGPAGTQGQDPLAHGKQAKVAEQPPIGGGPTLDDIDFASLLDEAPGEKGKAGGEDVFFVDTPSVPEGEFETPKQADSFSMEEITFDELDAMGGEGAAGVAAAAGTASAARGAAPAGDVFDLDMGAAAEEKIPSMDLQIPAVEMKKGEATAARPRAVKKKGRGLVVGLVAVVCVLVVAGVIADKLGAFGGLFGTDEVPVKEAEKKEARKGFGSRALASGDEYEDRLLKMSKELEISPDLKADVEEELLWTLAWYSFLFQESFKSSQGVSGVKLSEKYEALKKGYAGAIFKLKLEAMDLGVQSKWKEADQKLAEYRDVKGKKMAELLEKNKLTAVVAREDNLLTAYLAVENGKFDEAESILNDLISEKAGELYPALLLARSYAGTAARFEQAKDKAKADSERLRAIDRLKEVTEQFPAHTGAKLLLGDLLATEGKLDEAVALASACLDEGKKSKEYGLQVKAYRALAAYLQKKDDEKELLRVLEEMKTTLLAKKTGLDEPEDLLLVLCRLYVKADRVSEALGALELCQTCSSADYYVLQATTYEKSKLLNTAIDKAKKGYEKYPDNAELLMMLARLSKETGQVNSAVAYLEEILKLKPNNLSAALTLARLFLEIKDPPNARRVLLEAERYIEGSLELQEMLAQINEAMGDDAGTVSALSKIIQLKDDDNVRKRLAVLQTKQGNYQEALDQFEILQKRNLITPELRQAYAKCLKATGRLQDAVDVLKDLFRDNPGDMETARFLADIYLQKEDYFNAKYYLEAARRADTKNAEVHFLIGKCCLKLQDDDCAAEALKQATDLSPDNMEYVEKFANHLFKIALAAEPKTRSAAMKSAKKYFDYIVNRYQNDRTIPKDRQDADVYFNRGRILFETGHFDQALGDLDQALFLAKHRTDILTAYADTLYRMNRYEDALKYFQEMIDSKVDPAHAHYFMGQIHLTSGNREKAKASFMNCIALGSKKYPEAHRHLGDIFKEKGLRKMAWDHYKTYLQLVDPASPAAQEVKASMKRLM
jgi:tetratricopeptide (TPR) repeat protein